MLQTAGAATQHIWSLGPARVLPAPDSWPLLGSTVKPLGGQCIQVLAAPGIGKTTFCLYWALATGAKTLYFASDTDMRLMTEQMAAWATGDTRDDVREKLENGGLGQVAASVAQAAPDLFVDPMAGPALPQIEERIAALAEFWGETPQLVVLDTISDVRRGGDDYSAWRGLWLDLRALSRHYDTTIMFAHHVKGSSAGRDGDRAPQLSDGKYGAHEFCELVLGLHKPEAAKMAVTVLKNRGGMQGVKFPLSVDHARLELQEVAR